MRRPYVMVACAIGACAPAPEPPIEYSHNPPMPLPPVEVGAITETVNDGKLAPGTVLNARAAGQGLVFRVGESCVVYPNDGVQRPPGALPPAVELPCTPTMVDPAWAACRGTLETTSDPAVCTCHVGGNPPPPPTDGACPAHG